MRKDAGTFNREPVGKIVGAEERTDHERLADLLTVGIETGDEELVAILTDGSDSSTSKLIRCARLAAASEPAAPLTRET